MTRDAHCLRDPGETAGILPLLLPRRAPPAAIASALMQTKIMPWRLGAAMSGERAALVPLERPRRPPPFPILDPPAARPPAGDVHRVIPATSGANAAVSLGRPEGRQRR